MTGREWGDALCRRLHELVAAEAPAGLGAWGPAWDVVAAPSDALMRELDEIDAGKQGRTGAKRCAEDVRAAWSRAGMRYRAQQT